MWSAASVLVCALALLGRSASTFPPIELVATPPLDASVGTEGFVGRNPDTIYLVASTPVFRAAQRSPYRCGDRESLKKLASIIVHEEWHLRHGSDERGAYEAQLTALVSLGSGPGTPLYSSVFRSMNAVLTAQRRDQTALAGTGDGAARTDPRRPSRTGERQDGAGGSTATLAARPR